MVANIRVMTMMEQFPGLTKQDAEKLDTHLVGKVEEILKQAFEPIKGIQEGVYTALFLAYLKNNIDVVFEKAFGDAVSQQEQVSGGESNESTAD